MDKNSRDPVHCWLVWGKSFQATAKYLYGGLEETGIDDTDFRILEALLNKGPLPVNTIGPKVYLTPGSISVAIDRLLDRGLVSRVESPEDRRVRIVSLTPKGKELIAPIFRKHEAEIRRSEEHTSELQSRLHLVCRLLLEKKKNLCQGRLTVVLARSFNRPSVYLWAVETPPTPRGLAAGRTRCHRRLTVPPFAASCVPTGA